MPWILLVQKAYKLNNVPAVVNLLANYASDASISTAKLKPVPERRNRD
jgi:hypothetical protein